MTSKHWLALAILGSGAVSLTALTLFAKGRRQEAFALTFTAGVVSTVFAAARALDDGSTTAPKPAGVNDPGFGVAGLGRAVVAVRVRR